MGVSVPDDHCFQTSADGHHCLQLGTECIFSIVYPVINGLFFNHLVGTEDNLAAVKDSNELLQES